MQLPAKQFFLAMGLRARAVLRYQWGSARARPRRARISAIIISYPTGNEWNNCFMYKNKKKQKQNKTNNQKKKQNKKYC